MKIINGFHLDNVRGDILGGITAAVVALPLALAFGNAALGPGGAIYGLYGACLLYTSPSPRDSGKSRMPSSA